MNTTYELLNELIKELRLKRAYFWSINDMANGSKITEILLLVLDEMGKSILDENSVNLSNIVWACLEFNTNLETGVK